MKKEERRRRKKRSFDSNNRMTGEEEVVGILVVGLYVIFIWHATRSVLESSHIYLSSTTKNAESITASIASFVCQCAHAPKKWNFDSLAS